uniref:ATP synthase F0 subunit 6 n=1 Tax=Mycterothrips gongshanensis TaxID=2792509 RepID=UPI0022034972|nr:ATP synthase F0 subunit 6 [Mycterothrips gongshanensis]UXW64208.1 ATP synthase F0 subunit 6 [Mycterothrips gongshanensis]
MLSLFVSFDPKTSISIITGEANWLILMIFLTSFFYFFWSKPSRLTILKNSFLLNISSQFEIALKSKKDSSKMIFATLFIFILFSNFMGLIPNIFTSTSHLTFNLFLSIPMWTGFLFYGWTKYTNKMLAHLVPNGTPLPLISFMVLIELISTTIRPLTLSIRLMANMVSGHLLLTLMGNSMVSSSLLITMILVLVQTMLSSLEIGVAMIQAYVFCMLLTLYSDDSDYSKDH